MNDENLNYADPDPVVRNLESKLAATQGVVAALATDLQNLAHANQQSKQMEIHRAAQKLRDDTREFERHTPDVNDAHNSLRETRLGRIKASLKASGQPEYLAESIFNDEIARDVAGAHITGQNSAGVVYERAVEEVGWKSIHITGPRDEASDILKEIRK